MTPRLSPDIRALRKQHEKVVDDALGGEHFGSRLAAGNVGGAHSTDSSRRFLICIVEVHLAHRRHPPTAWVGQASDENAHTTERDTRPVRQTSCDQLISTNLVHYGPSARRQGRYRYAAASEHESPGEVAHGTVSPEGLDGDSWS